MNVSRSCLVYLPNILTLLRLPCAFLVWHSDHFVVLIALVVATISDFLDGFLARYFAWETNWGKYLDPIMDKIFAGSTIVKLYMQGMVGIWHVVALFSRDISVLVFGLYYLFRKKGDGLSVQPIWTGKLVTTLQLTLFFLLLNRLPCPDFLFSLVGSLGCLALPELFWREKIIKAAHVPI